MYNGMERRQGGHECKQEENIGKFKEFIANMEGFKVTLFTITLAFITQVGTFLFLWGGLTNTVNKNSNQLWEKLTPELTIATRNIDKILTKLDTIGFVYTVGAQGAQGAQGMPGIQGERGERGTSK